MFLTDAFGNHGNTVSAPAAYSAVLMDRHTPLSIHSCRRWSRSRSISGPCAPGAVVSLNIYVRIKRTSNWLTGFTFLFTPSIFVFTVLTVSVDTVERHAYTPGENIHRLQGIIWFAAWAAWAWCAHVCAAQTGECTFFVSVCIHVACMMKHGVNRSWAGGSSKWWRPAVSGSQREVQLFRHIGGRGRRMGGCVCLFISGSQTDEDAGLSDGCSLLDYTDVVRPVHTNADINKLFFSLVYTQMEFLRYLRFPK